MSDLMDPEITPTLSPGLVPAPTAPQQERERLRAAVEAARDRIADEDLALATLRNQLTDFETALELNLWHEQNALRRTAEVIRELERWIDVLSRAPRAQVPAAAKRLRRRRAIELTQAPEPPATVLIPTPNERTAAELLKSTYRTLARRYHPDLARNDVEQLRFSALMAHINELYAVGDLERLAQVAQSAGPEPTMPGFADEAAAIQTLRTRLATLEQALKSLEEERQGILASETHALFLRQRELAQQGQNLVVELKAELVEQFTRALTDVRAATQLLETHVQKYNHHRALASVASDASQMLGPAFDPHRKNHLVQLSLHALKVRNVSAAARAEAEQLEALAAAQPALLRLVLFAYICELSTLPIPGLERFAELEERFHDLGKNDNPPLTLTRALIEADKRVAFGVRHATEKMAFSGLKLLMASTREAMPLCLERLAVRTELRRLLSVLGEKIPCPTCARDVYVVPLFRLRGLDHLRALVCPDCGAALRRYWMPKGKDIQAILNPVYLELGTVIETELRLARTTLGMQWTTAEAEQVTLKELKRRLMTDLFERHDLGLAAAHVSLYAGRRELPPAMPVAELGNTPISIRLTHGAPLSTHEAVERLRQRIRARFSRA